jgi:Holliday junction resolvase
MKTEKDVSREIKDYFSAYGWLFIRNQQNIGSMKGISDYTMINKGVTIWLEVKGSAGKQSKYQEEFQKIVESRGGLYCIAHSIQDVLDFISEKLKRI